MKTCMFSLFSPFSAYFSRNYIITEKGPLATKGGVGKCSLYSVCSRKTEKG